MLYILELTQYKQFLAQELGSKEGMVGSINPVVGTKAKWIGHTDGMSAAWVWTINASFLENYGL